MITAAVIYFITILLAWIAITDANRNKPIGLRYWHRVLVAIFWLPVFFAYVLYLLILVGDLLEGMSDEGE